jgi:hypothetical protein
VSTGRLDTPGSIGVVVVEFGQEEADGCGEIAAALNDHARRHLADEEAGQRWTARDRTA